MNLIQKKILIIKELCVILKNSFILLFVFTLLSCNEEPKITTFAQKPKNLVNHAKMKVLLTEIHLAEAQVQTLKNVNKISEDTARAVFNEFQKRIFLKNKIDSLDFDKSYEYYVRSLQMDSIYKQVADTMKIITKKKTFGHEILPKPREIYELEPLDTINQKNNKGNDLFRRREKIPISEQS